ncbi:hypothetical protein [Domibacillus epiphyticus]|uniref:Uncharacterized protein n=1 Tax=Domibacillus epiphyticus TaxID=1714355 RepID=A0A1V2A3Q6_9BACI|nr:hypothetical protein [Domibacillus epiphyticus]OMP65623.1 hypothetical protein BTO28_16560 [Domibacillus epiphyticus]
MNIIKKKVDIQEFIENFDLIAHYDELGRKHYLVVPDRERGGDWTLMKYPNNEMTIHGKGVDYCDPDEQKLFDKDLLEFIWKNRKMFNSRIKESFLLKKD